MHQIHPSGTGGACRLIVPGLRTEDGFNKARQLRFDLRIAAFHAGSVDMLALPNLPHFPGICFGICPEIPCGLIGAESWETLRQTNTHLPPYRMVSGSQVQGGSAFLPNIGVVSRLPIVLTAGETCVGIDHPICLGVGSKVPPGACCLGRDFLRYGVVLWEAGYTHFFPFLNQETRGLQICSELDEFTQGVPGSSTCLNCIP